MKILCIDPSSSSPGFALFEDDKPLWCKTVSLKGSKLLDRMEKLIPYVNEMLFIDADYIAIETPYLGISKSTSMKMGQIFGIFCAIFLICGYSSDNIIEVHPMTVKKAAGVLHQQKREESKATVKHLMEERFPELNIQDDNSSDALAIGLAALNIINK